MSDKKVMNRWMVVVGALLIQLCLGAIYAWSVFTPGLKATTPKEFVDIYGAKQLGVEVAAHEALVKDLKEPKEELKTTNAKLKTESDETAKEELTAQKEALLAGINARILETVPQGNLDKLT